MHDFTCYLAGPINGRSDVDCKNWRAYAAERLHCKTYDPMVRDYRGREMEPGIATEIVELDKQDIDRCQFLLVYFDKPSVGTAMEVLYAWERRKEIVVVDAQPTELEFETWKPKPRKPLSPWLVYHSTFQCDSLDAAIDLINSALALRGRLASKEAGA